MVIIMDFKVCENFLSFYKESATQKTLSFSSEVKKKTFELLQLSSIYREHFHSSIFEQFFFNETVYNGNEGENV